MVSITKTIRGVALAALVAVICVIQCLIAGTLISVAALGSDFPRSPLPESALSIHFSSEGIINIQVSPVSDEPGVGSDTVSVATTNFTGFNLSISTNSETDNDLIHDSDTTKRIHALSDTSTLSSNTWGYTKTLTNPLTNTLFNPMPLKSDADSIAQSDEPTTLSPIIDDGTDTAYDTTVHYGAKADLTTIPGRYTTTVLYTAIPNDIQAAPVIDSITPQLGLYDDYTPVEISGENLDILTNITIGSGNCQDISIISATQATCTAAPHSRGPVDVTIVGQNGATDTLENGFYYYQPAVLVAGVNNTTVLGTSNIARANVKTITFENSLDLTTSPTGDFCWDAGAAPNQALVKACRSEADADGKYDVVVGGIGGVYANPDSRYLFANYTGLTEINFGAEFNTGLATNMSHMFSGVKMTSLDVSNFNTKNVAIMSEMFRDTSLVELDLRNWELDNLQNMYATFYYSTNLRSIRFGATTTPKLADIRSMFAGVNLRELTMPNFDFSHLTDRSIAGLFSHTNLEVLDISNINTTNITNMTSLFVGTSKMTTIDITPLDTASVVNMGNMFNGSSNPDLEIIGLDSLETDLVTNMSNMFYNVKVSSLDVTNFNTENVTNMASMFQYCTNLASLDVSGFDTKKVTNMFQMFHTNSSLVELDLRNWELDSLQNMYAMFYHSTNLRSIRFGATTTPKLVDIGVIFASVNPRELTMPNFDFSHLTDRSIAGLFAKSNLEILDISNINTANITNMSSLFSNASKLTALDITHFDTTSVTNMRNMFYNVKVDSLDVTNLNTENVTNMASMFYGCSNLTSLDVSNFDTRKVTTMSDMFTSITGITELDLRNWELDNLESLFAIFNGATNLRSIKFGTTTTPKLTNITAMFQNANPRELIMPYFDFSHLANRSMSSLFAKTNLEILDISNINTANITNMSSLFASTSKLTSIDISSFDTSSVTNMANMFNGSSHIDLEITGLDLIDTSEVTTMQSMFFGVKADSLDVSNFDTRKVTTIDSMFRSASNITELDLRNWELDSLTTMYIAFDGATSLSSIRFGTTTTPELTNIGLAFRSTNLRELTMPNFDFSHLADGSMASLFAMSNLDILDISNINTSNVTNMYNLFYGANKLTTLDLSHFDTASVTNMSGMFRNMTALTDLNLAGFDFSQVTNLANIMTSVPTTVSITLNAAGATWFNSNLPTYTNITIVP